MIENIRKPRKQNEDKFKDWIKECKSRAYDKYRNSTEIKDKFYYLGLYRAYYNIYYNL